MAPWVLHDLRRSLATGLGERLGVAPYVVEAILNHIDGHKRGVAGVYNRAVYEKEKRAALSAWANHVLAGRPQAAARQPHAPIVVRPDDGRVVLVVAAQP
jgi:hypothetical protein